MTLFDQVLVLKDKEGHPAVYDTIEQLDKLLTEYGVNHAFTLPRHEDIEL